uniref:Uncharacterized protein n=1 Tax=Arundo donax TaxID=35708 RepID=A0A0A9DFM1_ARUDO
MFSYHIVFVLVKELICLICDISCVVVNCKGGPSKFGLAEAFVCLVCLIHLLCECFMCGLWKHACLIQECNYSSRFLLNQVQHILIVYKLNIAPVNFLPCVFFLLHLEYMLIKVLLQLLICQIDT